MILGLSRGKSIKQAIKTNGPLETGHSICYAEATTIASSYSRSPQFTQGDLNG